MIKANVARRAILCVLFLPLLAGDCSFAGLIPTSTKPTTQIGLVAPFEGRYRDLGYEVLYAVKLALRQRNAAGGVAGYLVELVALNDGDIPEESAFQVRKLALDAGVMGVVGPFSEMTLAAAASLYRDLGLPAVTLATCPPAGYEGVFCFAAGADALAQALIQRIPPGAEVALLRAQQQALGDQLVPAARRVIEGPWDAGELVWRLDKGRPRPPGLYLYDGDVLGAADLLIEMRKLGVDTPLWGGPSLAREQLPLVARDALADACYVMTAPPAADLAPDSAFVTGYRELAGMSPGPWAALAYDATTALLDALERAIQADGQPSRQGVSRQLSGAGAVDGQPAFVQGQRQRVQTVFYCYDPGEGYPGHIAE